MDKNMTFELNDTWFTTEDKENINDLYKDGIIVKDKNKNQKEKRVFVSDCIRAKDRTPSDENIFRAFKLFTKEETRVLILGQDPYLDKDKACGLAFLQEGRKKLDDSLNNILTAIKQSEAGINKGYELESSWVDWAKKNRVLLLNTSLTYDSQNSISERRRFWIPFIQYAITDLLSSGDNPLAVFLWGNDAKETFFKCFNSFTINNNNVESKTFNKAKVTRKLMVFLTSHPSNNGQAYKKGFEEDAPTHFQICNEFLEEDAVDWMGLYNIYKKRVSF